MHNRKQIYMKSKIETCMFPLEINHQEHVCIKYRVYLNLTHLQFGYATINSDNVLKIGSH